MLVRSGVVGGLHGGHHRAPGQRANAPSSRCAGPGRHLQRTPIDPGSRHAEGRRKHVGEVLGAEARGVGGQQHEPFGGDQLGNLAEQGSEVVLEPPPTTPRAVAVTRRVENDAVEAPAAPKLACDEALRVIDDPADRPPGEPDSSAFRRAQATVGRDAST